VKKSPQRQKNRWYMRKKYEGYFHWFFRLFNPIAVIITIIAFGIGLGYLFTGVIEINRAKQKAKDVEQRIVIVSTVKNNGILSPVIGFSSEGIVERQKNKMMKCVDTRDGEVFYFNTNTVHNIYIGYGSPHRYDVVTSNGDTMTLKSDMEIYLKCKECKNDSIINKIKELYYERTIINN